MSLTATAAAVVVVVVAIVWYSMVYRGSDAERRGEGEGGLVSVVRFSIE